MPINDFDKQKNAVKMISTNVDNLNGYNYNKTFTNESKHKTEDHVIYQNNAGNNKKYFSP